MKLLLFAGAGASVELGVPAMRRMTEQLVKHLAQQGFSDGVIDKFKERLSSPKYDMESLVDELDSMVKGQAAASQWGHGGMVDDISQVRTLRQETEWFIQHLCERIRLRDAHHLWAPTLRKIGLHDATLATTNYDRAIEQAAASISKSLDDGFEEHSGSEAAAWRGFQNDNIKYLKLHGSTNWYRSDDGEPYKLRHPMKLFGDLEISYAKQNDGIRLSGALVLPSREKVVRESPYDDARFEFQNAYKNTDIAFFLGSSLRDPGIKKAANRSSKHSFTYIVDPNIKDTDEVVPNEAKILNLTSSQFLCSLLPSTISSADNPSQAVNLINKYSDRFDGTHNILHHTVQAHDKELSSTQRCDAIEFLAKQRTPLPGDEIRRLLDTEDNLVGQYALGLIPNSPDKSNLIQYVNKIPKDDKRPGFAKEVKLLSAGF